MATHGVSCTTAAAFPLINSSPASADPSNFFTVAFLNTWDAVWSAVVPIDTAMTYSFLSRS
jgi:hypothetical protein